MLSRKIRAIENCSLDLDERVELLLIGETQKPATIIYLYQNDIYDPEKGFYPLDESSLRETRKLLDFLGFPYRIGEKRLFKNNRFMITKQGIKQFPPVERIYIYVASNLNNLQRILKASEVGDEMELGRCFGFPETAIQAYMGMRDRFRGSTARNKSVEGYFTRFIFSQDFFKEELKGTSLRWYETLKERSKKLYDEIAERQKNPILIK